MQRFLTTQARCFRPASARSFIRTERSSTLLGLALLGLAIPLQAEDGSPAVLDPLVVMTGQYLEEQPVGEAAQPEWVMHRRFGNTRVYIQKSPWEWGVEEWYRVRTYDDGRVTQRFQQELEIGLPYRMQLDLYEKIAHDNSDGRHWEQDEFAVELRWAPADWGVLPGNPTLYLEYAFAYDGPDLLETKLLFGEDYHGWHWGLNLINAHPIWGPDENEWATAAGLSRTLVDNVFSVGVEAKWTHEDHEHSEVIVGPSVQWRPTRNTHLDLVVQFGANHAAPNTECWLIFGWDFGPGVSRGYQPTTVGGL